MQISKHQVALSFKPLSTTFSSHQKEVLQPMTLTTGVHNNVAQHEPVPPLYRSWCNYIVLFETSLLTQPNT